MPRPDQDLREAPAAGRSHRQAAAIDQHSSAVVAPVEVARADTIEHDGTQQITDPHPSEIIEAILGTQEIRLPAPSPASPMTAVKRLIAPSMSDQVPVSQAEIEAQIYLHGRRKNKGLITVAVAALISGAMLAGASFLFLSKPAAVKTVNAAWRVVAVDSDGITAEIGETKVQIKLGELLPNGEKLSAVDAQADTYTSADGSSTKITKPSALPLSPAPAASGSPLTLPAASAAISLAPPASR